MTIRENSVKYTCISETMGESYMEKAERKYKANPDFLLREVAGEAVLIPVGEAGVFENSVISLNAVSCGSCSRSRVRKRK